jgi:hypothetical protein
MIEPRAYTTATSLPASKRYRTIRSSLLSVTSRGLHTPARAHEACGGFEETIYSRSLATASETQSQRTILTKRSHGSAVTRSS